MCNAGVERERRQSLNQNLKAVVRFKKKKNLDSGKTLDYEYILCYGLNNVPPNL